MKLKVDFEELLFWNNASSQLQNISPANKLLPN